MKGFTQMANIVFKLSDKDITTLMSRISFDTENLPQGMKARAKYQNTTVNIYQSGKVMFKVIMQKLCLKNFYRSILN